MKSIRKWIRDFFGFSTNEISGFLVLIPLMIALAVSEPLYRWWTTSQPRDYSADLQVLDTLVAQWRATERDSVIVSVALMMFNPNTASEETLRTVGLSDILAKRIAAYRRKGGVFRTKSDLTKIYGLDSALYHQLYNYIDLPEKRLPTLLAERPYRKENHSAKAPQEIFDINTADTLLLETVYGIGPKLAVRIVKFRDRLGGFVRTDQLYEVFGLDSIVVTRLLRASYIKAGFLPRKININTAGEQMLAAHPYIRHSLARRITSYRFQHGDFQKVSDIKKISASANDNLDRLLTYIKVED